MIKCEFTCDLCGVKDAAFEVRERGPQENVIEWMDNAVKPAVGRAHFAVSPFCRATKLTQVKIPFVGGRVGDPVKH